MRSFMEHHFGHDFSHVRVHTDSQAAESARAVDALAYTVGSDVVFDRGYYRPGTTEGKRLLAHELTHVVQQSAATRDPGPQLAVDSSHSSHESEAEASADQLQTQRPSVTAAPMVTPSAVNPAKVQRFVASEHTLLGDATEAALSQIMGLLSSAELQLRQGTTAWRELVLARDLWSRNSADPQVLELLERATNANDEGAYETALGFLEQATPLVMTWLREHPEAGGGATTSVAGREHPEIAALQTADQTAREVHLTLRTSGVDVTYGEIIALADFYPSVEAMHNAPREELINADHRGILDLIRAEVSGRRDLNFDLEYQKATEWREVRNYDNLGRDMGLAGADVGEMSYTSLARVNPEHFAILNKSEWTTHHDQALSLADGAQRAPSETARSEGSREAYTVNAFGDHFLTDAFAGGHLMYKASYIALAGSFWNDNREACLDAFADSLLNDHRAAIIHMVAQESIPVPIFGPALAWIVATFSPDTIKSGIKDKIRDIERTEPDVIPNAAVKVAHDYYNENGVDVQNQMGDRWRTFGDDHLNRSATTWQIATLAVVRSRADVTETIQGRQPADSQEAWKYTPIPPENFDQTAFEQARRLMLLSSGNPLANLFINNLPMLERAKAFERREEERAAEAQGRQSRYIQYLQFIRRSDGIEDHMDSDDVAREIVANATVYATLTLREKAILILEMLSGFTGDEDERAILTILRDVQGHGQLQDLLLWVPIEDLKSDLHGAEYDQLMQILDREPFQISFDDCPFAWKQSLLTSVQSAKTWVSTAAAKVSAIVGNPATSDPTTHQALRDHFHITSGPGAEGHVRQVWQGLVDVQSAFGSEVPFECETQCDTNVQGYVYSGLFGLVRTLSDVHMCPDWFSSTDAIDKSVTIIHEMSHKYSGTADTANANEPAIYQHLTVDQALDNAESFGLFVRDVR